MILMKGRWQPGVWRMGSVEIGIGAEGWTRWPPQKDALLLKQPAEEARKQLQNPLKSAL